MSVRRVLRDPVEQELSPLELLFDLVFVLGVSQLTRQRSASSALNADPGELGVALWHQLECGPGAGSAVAKCLPIADSCLTASTPALSLS